jgi:hypothetical protein
VPLRSFVCVVAGVLVAITQAGATTYTYTGNTDQYFGTGAHITATAELNCGTSCSGGFYSDNSGLSSFSLTVYDGNNNAMFTNSSGDGSDINFDTGQSNYLFLNDSGVVTQWFLWIVNIFHHGIATANESQCGCSRMDPRDAAGSLLEGFQMATQDDPGSWTAPTTPPPAATPLPAALPLFAAGLGALGLFGWHRKRKYASAIAAA